MRFLILLLILSGCHKTPPLGVELDGVTYVPAMMAKIGEIEGRAVYAPGYMMRGDYEAVDAEVRKEVSRVMWLSHEDDYSEILK